MTIFCFARRRFFALKMSACPLPLIRHPGYATGLELPKFPIAMGWRRLASNIDKCITIVAELFHDFAYARQNIVRTCTHMHVCMYGPMMYKTSD